MSYDCACYYYYLLPPHNSAHDLSELYLWRRLSDFQLFQMSISCISCQLDSGIITLVPFLNESMLNSSPSPYLPVSKDKVLLTSLFPLMVLLISQIWISPSSTPGFPIQLLSRLHPALLLFYLCFSLGSYCYLGCCSSFLTLDHFTFLIHHWLWDKV